MSETDEPTEEEAPASGRGILAAPVPRSIAAIVRAVPFTTAIVLVTLVLGIASAALWRPLVDQPRFEDLAYGLPNLVAGRWWTPATGPWFAPNPLTYLTLLIVMALLLGWAEWRLGTARAAVAAVTGQVVGVLGSAAVLALLGGAASSWDWAARVATALDVGPTPGVLAAVAAASAVLLPPWRGRLRFLLVLFVAVTFIYLGTLGDLQRLVAVAVGLVIGPLLNGHRPVVRVPRFTRREWRLTAATLFLLAAVIRLVVWLFPADGPLGHSDSGGGLPVLAGAAISLILAEGLRRGRRTAWRWALVLTVLAVAFVALLVGALTWAAITQPDVLSVLSDARGLPAAVVDMLLWLAQLAVLVLGRSAFRSPSARVAAREAAGTTADRALGIALLHEHGGGSLSWMGTWPANSWYIQRDESGMPIGAQAYQLHRNVAIALGDPIGEDPSARARVLDGFVDQQIEAGRGFCLFSVSDEVASWSDARGFQHVQVAEEAVVSLPGLEFTGKHWQSTRSALNRATREEVRYVEGALADQPFTVVAQVRGISEAWVGDKGLPEMGFTLGGVDEALDPEVRCGLAIDAGGRVHGVTSWLPVYGPGGTIRGWTLDVMRRRPDGFPPVTEFLIASACLSFKEQGAQWASLSGAPLARADRDAQLSGLDRLLDGIGSLLEPLYGFGSLEAFKQKFSPQHIPLHMVFADEAALPRISLALTEAYLPDASATDLARAGIDAMRGA